MEHTEKIQEEKRGLAHFIGRHKAAIIGAILFGILLSAPFFIAHNAPSFTGVYPELVDDQNFYLSRIQDVRDGYPASGNTYLAEYKDAVPMQFLTGEFAYAMLLDAFSLPTPAGLIVFQFVFPPIIFLLTYAIFLRLGTPRFWALMGTLLLVFSVYFFTFARPISPQFNLIFWLVAVLSLFSMAKHPSWKWVMGNALILGILFYLYPYYWTHLVATYGLVFVVIFCAERRTAYAVFWTVLGAIILGSGYLALILKTRGLPEYWDSLMRTGFIETHFPSGALLIIASLVTLAIAAYFIWHKDTRHEVGPVRKGWTDRNVLLSVALLLGGLVVMNQHVITGINMEFSSHYALQIVFASVFLLREALTAGHWWPRLAGFRTRGAALAAVLLVSIFFVGSSYAESLKRVRDSEDVRSELGTVIRWLKENAPERATVYAPEELASVIPAYTPHDVFFARHANIAFMPQTEVVDRFIIQHYGTPITDEFVRENERALFGVHYINRYNHAALRAQALSYVGIESPVPERLPQSEIDAIKKRAEELYTQPFEMLIAPYNVTYFVAPKGGTPAFSMGSPLFTTKTFEVFKATQ